MSRRRARVLLALAGLLVAVRAVLPYAAARIAEDQASAALGRVVRIGNIDLALLAGGVTVEGLLVGDAAPEPGVEPPTEVDPEHTLLVLERLEANIGWTQLPRGLLQLEHAEVHGLGVRMEIREDGTLVPVVLAEAQAGPEPESVEDDEAGEPWPIHVQRVRLTDQAILLVAQAEGESNPLEFGLEELSVDDVWLADGEIRIGPVHLRVPSLRVRRDITIATSPPTEAGDEAPAEEPDAGEAETGEPAGGPPPLRLQDLDIQNAEMQLVLDDEPLDVSASLAISDAVIAPGADPFPVRLRLVRESGWLELAGNASVMPIGFRGTLEWDDFPLVQLIAAAQPEATLRIRGGSSSGSLELGLETAGTDPHARVNGSVEVRDFRVVETTGLLNASVPALEVAADEVRIPLARTSQPLSVSLSRVALAGGSVEVADERVSPAYHESIKKLDVNLANLRMPARDADLDIGIRSKTGMSIDVEGGIEGGRGRTTLALENLVLSTLNGYVGPAVGFEFTSGRLALAGDVESRGGTHDLESNLVLTNLGVRDVQAGAFEKSMGMSAGTAIALLTDPRGNIAMPINLSVDEEGASIDVAAIFTGAIQQSLWAIAAAPLKGLGLALGAAGGLVGGGGEGLSLEPVRFEPGSAVVTEAGKEFSALLANALRQRPAFRATLHGSTGSNDDPVLAARILSARIEADRPPDGYRDLGILERRRARKGLEATARNLPTGLEGEARSAVERWIDELEIPEADREALARRRADALRRALVAEPGIEGDRVSVGSSRSGDAGVVPELQGVDG